MNASNDTYHSLSAASIRSQQMLSILMAPSTKNLTNLIPNKNGLHGLDLGCGTGENTLRFSKFVGKKIKISGIDSNEAFINIAKESLLNEDISNVDFRHQDLWEWNEFNCYDFVYSNHFIYKSSDPIGLLEKVYHCLKPGGLVIIEDLDFSKTQHYPYSYAFDRFIELFTSFTNRWGVDPNTGKNLPSQLEQVGFHNCQAQLVRPKFLRGRYKHLISLTLESMRSLLIEEKLVHNSEIHALLYELKYYESLKHTMITLPGIYQIWGNKI